MLRIVDYSATTLLSLEDAWHELDEPVDWFILKRFAAGFMTFKGDISKMDFTDMLLVYMNSGEPVDIEVAVVDEAQDLTAAQWKVVEKAFSKAKRIYVGGDDDQAIYRWAGADVEYFLQLSEKPEVLPVSYRLPRKIFDFAGKLASRITHRYPKSSSADNREGEINFHTNPESVDLGAPGTWLLLARNGYLLRRLVSIVREYGINYTTREGPAINPKDIAVMRLWERCRLGKVDELSAEEVRSLFKATDLPVPQLRETQRYVPRSLPLPWDGEWYDSLRGITLDSKDFYINCLHRGTKLSDPPRVRIETIHGVKGAEADNVLIMTDISAKTLRSYNRAPDHEHRVFYVGMTRAKHALHIVLPQSDTFYPI